MANESPTLAALTPTLRVCPTCRSEITKDAPHGLCPSCLIARVAHRRSAILSDLLPAAPASDAPALAQLQLPPPDRVASVDDWRDPLAERDPAKYGGAFLAGMAPVGHTDLVVTVQSRADEATALDADPRLRVVAWSGVALALLGLAFAAVSAARRRHRRLAYER